MSRPTVVIIGAGFGGIECAKKLDGGPVDVKIVDRNNYHVFSPLLYQVASSLLNPSDIAYPVRRIFAGSPNVRFVQADVEAIDFDEQRLRVAGDEDDIAYDHLVMASGSTTNYFGNQAIEAQALGLKNLSEALQLRNHILTCLEAASRQEDPEAQRAFMTFVIVGGGPTGIEYAGALAELMRLVLPREYPQIRVPARIVVAEGRDRLLAAFSDELSAYTKQRLESLGVEVRLETLVQGATEDEVLLGDGERLPAHTLVWSAGVKPGELSTADGLPTTDRSRRVVVDEHLRIEGRSACYAIGDVAGAEQDGAELPMLSAPAMQQGRYVADFILAHLGPSDDPVMAPFRYVDKGTMATIGRNAAVCAVGELELTGFLGWLGWLVVHIYYLIGYRNRLVVMWSWCWNYLLYDRPVRIITDAKAPLLDEG